MKVFKSHGKQSPLFTFLLYHTKIERQIRKINRDIEKSPYRQVDIANFTSRNRSLVNNVMKMRSRCKAIEECIETLTGKKYNWSVKRGRLHNLFNKINK